VHDVITLYRPVGTKELALIEELGFQAFPPRLEQQPIFYPVLNESYAVQIARDWNTKHNEDRTGYVTRFNVHKTYIDQYEVHIVGGRDHQEYWIPSDQLKEFNKNIVGLIEVIAEFRNVE